MENQNTRQYLDQIKQHILENLRILPHSPSVQMHQVPPDMLSMEVPEEPSLDVRETQHETDSRVEHSAEYYDSDKDQDLTYHHNIDNV
ncbi:PREDICTED: histone deacetylase 3-like [Amphimedon queenslandica]|uniref:Uncharacterized protein n=1 Tax=Amphimedon queenslandica TaxID=400682 RepID=A0AAN0IR65_AMPQE|nr:PREDICTED: histone deacetylase 3-like [Amphimedon queenslandica]|eukprot:XP_011407649.1 PREDICTED: histone deacetylase 3-like [Amphimedon queenslandica]